MYHPSPLNVFISQKAKIYLKCRWFFFNFNLAKVMYYPTTTFILQNIGFFQFFGFNLAKFGQKLLLRIGIKFESNYVLLLDPSIFCYPGKRKFLNFSLIFIAWLKSVPHFHCLIEISTSLSPIYLKFEGPPAGGPFFSIYIYAWSLYLRFAVRAGAGEEIFFTYWKAKTQGNHLRAGSNLCGRYPIGLSELVQTTRNLVKFTLCLSITWGGNHCLGPLTFFLSLIYL